MSPLRKKIAIGVAAAIGLVLLGIGGYGFRQVAAFDASLERVYPTPVPSVTRSTDPAVVARGKHLVESIGACATRDCHGTDLGGGKLLDLGPIGTVSGPNLTSAGVGAAYSDGELMRLLQRGVKRDGRGVRMMPVQDFGWLPERDVVAMISYLRTVPAVERQVPPMQVKPLAKILDRRNELVWDVARRLETVPVAQVPVPSDSVEYGAFLARLCTGCHGERLSGGPIPGAPPSLPVPLNITPDASGMKDWSYADFEHLLATGLRKNGQKLNPFMPVEALVRLDETERKALWNYLRSVPARPFGQR